MSICKECLHSKVCGMMGIFNPGLNTCPDKIYTGCSWIEIDPSFGIYECPNCGYIENSKKLFCAECGSKFNL